MAIGWVWLLGGWVWLLAGWVWLLAGWVWLGNSWDKLQIDYTKCHGFIGGEGPSIFASLHIHYIFPLPPQPIFLSQLVSVFCILTTLIPRYHHTIV